MYTLRIIQLTEKNGFPTQEVVECHELGDAYTKLVKGKTSEFDEIMKSEFQEYDSTQVRALIKGNNGKSFFILDNSRYKDIAYYYYIMTDSGRTLEKI
ncbi:hypothetical protein [uncultured Bacteroides sp.]|uniref:hypothetical protein n=1 Tax=uncultured Bacteroides sp. TaxID=162156 RepID=UPI0026179E77|nr:hypothetical protein [uncultured Bacteroides sp.]